MNAHTEYEQLKERYIELVNRKKILQTVLLSQTDPETLSLARSDLRTIEAELQEIFENNIGYFDDDKTRKK